MKMRMLLLLAALAGACLLAARAGSLKIVHSWLNHAMQRLTRESLPLPYPAPPPPEEWRSMDATARLIHVRTRLLPKLHEQLAATQCKLGQPAFIRIFKESRELELWLQRGTGEWRLFRTYPIACFSGTLGPKTREGDMQAPEGFYQVTPRMLNPASSYHLAFNIGYPNAYDLAQKRTGSLIMVHGDMCSVGCFAMTDAVIEEIYLVVEAALKDGGSVAVHSFPFRMTAERMGAAEAAHLDFWQELVPAYEVFEKERRVPAIGVVDGRYRVGNLCFMIFDLCFSEGEGFGARVNLRRRGEIYDLRFWIYDLRWGDL